MDISRIFATDVFDERAMKRHLSPTAYRQFKNLITHNLPLTQDIANAMAKAMKRWAIKRGATHYAHWFLPLTNTSAQKHESFVTPKKSGVIMSLTGEELIKGECDASSFPSGGLCSTCNARGYTIFDPTSPAFIKDGVLYIPSVFCSYDGKALDKKTPLLRSIQSLSTQCIRLLNILGKKVDHIDIEVGAEQEYFLVDSDIVAKRKDLLYTGRTLFGKAPYQCQSNHYLSEIKPKVECFMRELDKELLKLGIPAKTRHNENAPCQHEFAPVFTTVNLAVDQNQLTMELMQRIAKRFGLTCLLHEKPFEGMNGSGKHNNWSISTKYGNLFDVGAQAPLQFLLMLCAFISAVDTHQDLLRIAVAGASNDLRLGSSEAPPSIISIFLGDELTSILMSNEHALPQNKNRKLDIGVSTLPKIGMDLSDRNRTSPIAFIGNKFEFRMCGASQCIADINTVINTILAEQFEKFANTLQGSKDLNSDIHNIIKQTMAEHSKIIFNGDNYSPLWQEQARDRGLENFSSSVNALAHMTDKKNVELFEKQKVFSYDELKARQNVYIQNYCQRIKNEGYTMLDIFQNDILPAVQKYKNDVVSNAKNCLDLGNESTHELHTLTRLSALIKSAIEYATKLRNVLNTATMSGDNFDGASVCQRDVTPCMNQLRAVCNTLEIITPKEHWRMPAYSDILFCND